MITKSFHVEIIHYCTCVRALSFCRASYMLHEIRLGTVDGDHLSITSSLSLSEGFDDTCRRCLHRNLFGPIQPHDSAAADRDVAGSTWTRHLNQNRGVMQNEWVDSSPRRRRRRQRVRFQPFGGKCLSTSSKGFDLMQCREARRHDATTLRAQKGNYQNS
jgi:hypothetical protein